MDASIAVAVRDVDLAGGGDGNFKTVTQLWSDVPRMDGMTVSEIEMPLFAKLLMQTMMNQVLGGGTSSGDWIFFTIGKTPDDVKGFYTTARMTATKG